MKVVPQTQALLTQILTRVQAQVLLPALIQVHLVPIPTPLQAVMRAVISADLKRIILRKQTVKKASRIRTAMTDTPTLKVINRIFVS